MNSAPTLSPWQSRFAIVAAFLAGFAVPISTAAENITVGLMVLAFLLTPALWRELPRVVRQPFVLGCLSLYAVLLFGSVYSSVGLGGASSMLLKMREYLLVPLLFAVCLHLPARRALLIGFAAGTLLSVLVSTGMAIVGMDAVQAFNDWCGRRVLQAVPGRWDWEAFRSHTFHNLFASLLMLTLFIMHLTGAMPKKWRPWSWAVMAICLVDIMFLVQGRTVQGLLLLLVGLVLVMWNRRIGWILALCALLVVPPVLYLGASGIRHGIARFERDMDLYRQGQVDTSVGLRLDFYKNSLALVKEKPLLGHGTGSFAAEYRRLTGYTEGNVATKNPHNDYLWMGVELGALGIVALLGLLGATLVQARRQARPERWTVIVLTISMALSTLANSLFTDNVSRIGFILLACALLAGETLSVSNKTEPAA